MSGRGRARQGLSVGGGLSTRSRRNSISFMFQDVRLQ